MDSSALAVYTTIYPQVSGYLSEWHHSVCAQTDRDFELWISLDAMEPTAVEEIVGCKIDAHWLRTPEGSTPARIRQLGLAQIAASSSGIVLVDADDLLEPSRVEAGRAQLASNEVGGCALTLVDQRGCDLNVTFNLPALLASDEVLPRWNVFGFSNSVYDSKLVSRILPIPDDAALVDWYLATRAWLVGSRMGFDRVPRMKYRQHPGTMAHVVPPFTRQQVSRHTELVRHHFKLVLAAPPEGFIPQRYNSILEVQSDTERFWQEIVHDEAKLQWYVQALNDLELEPVWWTSVAHPSLRSMWNS